MDTRSNCLIAKLFSLPHPLTLPFTACSPLQPPLQTLQTSVLFYSVSRIVIVVFLTLHSTCLVGQYSNIIIVCQAQAMSQVAAAVCRATIATAAPVWAALIDWKTLENTHDHSMPMNFLVRDTRYVTCCIVFHFLVP